MEALPPWALGIATSANGAAVASTGSTSQTVIPSSNAVTYSSPPASVMPLPLPASEVMVVVAPVAIEVRLIVERDGVSGQP